jgi:hypothetical protein
MFGPLGNSQPTVVVILVSQAVRRRATMRNTLGGDAAISRRFQATRRDVAKAPLLFRRTRSCRQAYRRANRRSPSICEFTPGTTASHWPGHQWSMRGGAQENT